MADRYWVGGTDTWDATAGTKWALTSGGAGGQAVPTSADDVFFDAASGASTVTIGAGTAICSTLTCTGFTGTLAFGINSITCAGTGSIYVGDATYTVTGTSPTIRVTSTTNSSKTFNGGAATEANSINCLVVAGQNNMRVANTVRTIDFFNGGAGTFTGAFTNDTKTIYGNLILKTGMTITAGTSVTTFAATSGTQTITSAGLTQDCPITFAGTATYQLVDAMTVGSTRTTTLTSGTLDLNDKTYTTGLFSSSNSNTRSILFGTTGNITLTSTGTVWTTSTVTNFSLTGTPTVNLTNSTATARTITPGATTEANSISFNITAGNGTFNISASNAVKNLNFTGFTGALALAARTIYGNLTLVSGMTLGSGASTQTFAATSGTQTITSAGLTQNYPITFSGTATYQLVDAMTVDSTRTTTLTSGTLDLNDKTLTTGIFSSTNSNTRAILFGTTGSFNIVGNNTTIFNMATATNFTYTGTPTVNLTYSGSVGTRTVSVGNGAGGSQATALDYNVSAGSDIVSIFIHYRNLDFTGFTGTCTSNTRVIYGNLTLVSGMTLGGGTLITTFASTLLQQNITTAAKTIDNPITLSGTQTYQLQDALTMGVTRGITHTSGTLDLNDKTLTANFFNSNNANVRSIAFGTLGEINLVATSGTLWTTTNITNFSVTGTPTVNATDAGVGNTRTFSQGPGLSNQAVSIYVKAGSGTVNLNTTNGVFKTIDLTGFAGTVAHSSIFVLGDYVIPAAVTVTSSNTIQFVGTDVPQQITTSGNVMNFPVVVGRNFATTAATGNGTTATLTYASTVYYPLVGQTIIVSGVTPAGYNGTFTVTASSATTVSYLNATTGAQTVAGAVSIDASVQLQDAYTGGATRLFGHNSGTLDLNNNNLTVGLYSGQGNVPHTILFGTANITLTGNNATIWANSSSSLYPYIATGTKDIYCTYSGSTGVRTINPAASTEINALNFHITAGSDIASLQGNRQYNDIDFIGFSGTCVVASSSTANIVMYGSWTCPASGAGAIFLSSTTPYGLTLGSGTPGKTQTLTSNGYVFDCPISKTNNSTSILLLADDLVVTDATSSGRITLTNGVFNSNGKNVTCAEFDGNNTNTKTLTLTNSTVTITNGDASIAGFYLTSTGSTVNATGSNIIFTTSGATSFYGAGAGNTWPQVTMSGTGQLVIGTTGASNVITTLTNTVQPCTISIRSTTNNTTVTNFNLNGTAGNLVTFNSSVAGIQKPIIKASGTVNAYYLAIQDSAASGGATWRAISSVNNGNNTGWFFDYTETVIEDSTLADIPDTTASFLSNITEPITVQDAITGNATFIGAITENTTLADTQSAIASFAAAIVEAATLEDASIVLRTAFGDISEAIILDNSQTVIANFANVVFENIDVADTQSVVASFAAVITEDTNLQDLQEATAAFVASLAEAITVEDSNIGVKIHNSDITEIITIADTETVIAAFAGLVSENLNLADLPTVIASFNSQITENLVLLDSPFPRGWYAINDGQTSNWNQVNNTDSNNWTGVDNEQATTWTKVNNSYP